jgi:hypothetical protein
MKNFFLSVILILFALFSVNYINYPDIVFAEESAKWSGVDETVVEKFASAHNRVAKEPFINTDQGDLLLFVFLLAGTLGGFVGGYYWRALTENKPKTTHSFSQIQQTYH